MAVALSDLRTRAQARGDFESDANVSTAAWNAFINGSRKKLRRLLVAANPQQFVASKDFSLTGTTHTYVLTSNVPTFWKALSLDKLNSSNADDFEKVKRFLWAERNRLGQRSYRIYASTLEVRPASLNVGDYRLWFIEQPVLLVADGDALTLVEDMWDEFIVLEAAVKARRRQQKSADDLVSELSDLVKEIPRMAGDNDVGEADRILDVDDDGSFWRPALPGA